MSKINNKIGDTRGFAKKVPLIRGISGVFSNLVKLNKYAELLKKYMER